LILKWLWCLLAGLLEKTR